MKQIMDIANETFAELANDAQEEVVNIRLVKEPSLYSEQTLDIP